MLPVKLRTFRTICIGLCGLVQGVQWLPMPCARSSATDTFTQHWCVLPHIATLGFCQSPAFMGHFSEAGPSDFLWPDLCTSKATGHMNSHLLFPPTSAPAFFFPLSIRDCFSGYDRKARVPDDSPFCDATRDAAVPLGLIGVGLSSKKAQITLENHAFSSICLDCSLQAPNRIKGSFWTAWDDHIFNQCSQVSQRYLKIYCVLTH